MIYKTRDAGLINAICNSAGVRPWIDYRNAATEDEMDFSLACEEGSGVVFLTNGEDAIGCFCVTGNREYQAHTFFADTCRGKQAIETAMEMLKWMQPAFADRIWGATPIDNAKARWFNRQIGFQVVGHDIYEAEGPVEIVERLSW